MAKQNTPCACGGTFDGTPSGKKRHEASNQHRTYAAQVELNAGLEQAIATLDPNSPTYEPTIDPVERAANDPEFAGTNEGQAALEAAAKEAKIARSKAAKEPKEAPVEKAPVAPVSPEKEALLKTVKARRADVIWARNKGIGGDKLTGREARYDAAVEAYTAAGGEWNK